MLRFALIQSVLVATIIASFAPFSVSAGDAPSAAVIFESKVRPILKAHCWHCHGEEEELKGGLDTRLAKFLLKGGDSGPAVVSGKHSESLLYERVIAGEMPPGKKKLSAQELATIAAWIDAGVPVARPEPEKFTDADAFTDEERAHWSLQPIRRPPVPAVKQPELARTPVDAFLLERLERDGVSFSPQADRATLIRRLYFNLIGLPPAPEDVDRFVSDPSEDAYDRLVDELLASPAYGERWGRHWLDVAGYADSDGYSNKDPERLWAFKYRDYVVRSLNADKPWDQFLIEQIAGDELLTPPYANLTPEQADCLIATGFLRMGPDGTGDSDVDQDVARNEVVAETIKIVSTSVLGLTVGCAQCHTHRYDPISQTDYYRLRALFAPAYDWHNWRAPGARLVSLWTDDVRRQVAAAEDELKNIANQRTADLDRIVAETFERELAKLPADVQPAAKGARDTPADKRTPEQQQLIKQYPFLNVDRGSVYLYLPDRLTGFTSKWDALTEAAQKKRPPDDNVHCLTEVPGHLPPTKLFFRGDFRQERQEVAPGELAVLNSSDFKIPVDDAAIPTSGRRLAYARHLTDGKHPLVARVIVNRIWMHHFGRGLVATPGDFGVLGERPSHPELLDWLADEFMRGGWRLKRLHGMILKSTVYRQASVHRDELDAVDPDNRLLGRMPVRRLEAETIRDALLSLSGRMSRKMFGKPVPVMPDEVGQIVVGVDTRDSAGRPTDKVVPLGEDEFRRSIYVQVKRSMPLGMLEPFDAPLMSPNCERRASSTVAPQSLLMMNSEFVHQQAEELARRIESEAGAEPAARFEQAWQLIFARKPSEAEVQSGLNFLTEQPRDLENQASADQESDPKSDPKQNPPADRARLTLVNHRARLALANLCHALMISNAFLYVD